MSVSNLLKSLHRDRDVVLSFCSKFKHIYIYGAGYIAELFYEYLSIEEIEIEGVIISDGQSKCEFHNLPVYFLSEITFSENDGIVVALNLNNRRNVVPLLTQKGVLGNCFFRSGVVLPVTVGVEDVSPKL